ncbi:sulfite exporter TauE/SafE family protein [Myxococcota bacterium]|nr:sulfite exporter TauE/SafE family protein [Myxococcota bacterium]
MVSGALVGAALAGVSGAPHCLGMCGGFAVACGGRPTEAAAWHLGKLTTYAALGAAAGAVGQGIPGPDWAGQALALTMLLWFAGRLAGLLPAVSVPHGPLSRVGGKLLGRGGVLSRFGFGLVNGLLPCGLVYAALAMPVATQSAAWGALTMLVFGLGTLPGLLAASLGLRRITQGSIWGRRALALVVLLLGVGSIWARPTSAPVSPDSAASAPPCPLHAGPNDAR